MRTDFLPRRRTFAFRRLHRKSRAINRVRRLSESYAAAPAARRIERAGFHQQRHNLTGAGCVRIHPLCDGRGREQARAVRANERHDVARGHQFGRFQDMSRLMASAIGGRESLLYLAGRGLRPSRVGQSPVSTILSGCNHSEICLFSRSD